MTTKNPTPTALDTPSTDVVDSTWDVDGVEYRIVRFDDTPSDDVAVHLLQEALDCTVLEAEHAFRVIREDGEFVTSVHADIEELPLFAA